MSTTRGVVKQREWPIFEALKAAEQEEKAAEQQNLMEALVGIFGEGSQNASPAKPLKAKKEKDVRPSVREPSSSPETSPRTALAKKLSRRLAINAIGNDESYRKVLFLGSATSSEDRKSRAISRKLLTLSKDPKPPQVLLPEVVPSRPSKLHTHPSNVKTYEEHVESIMHGPRTPKSGSVKIDYFNFVNIMIKDKGLGEPVAFEKFKRFYAKLTDLVMLLRSDKLDEYVLRHHEEASAADEVTVAERIRRISHEVVLDLISFGFKGPEGKIIYWSGPLAREKAMADDSGMTDEQILLLQVLWGFDSLVDEKEKEKPSVTDSGDKNSIHLKLMVAFSSILADFSEGKEADYLLGYKDGAMNTSSAAWMGEFPVLMALASKINFCHFDGSKWKDPVDIKDPRNSGVLDKLKIRRIDYGPVSGPKSKPGSELTIGEVKAMTKAWKGRASMERWLREIPESTC